MKYALIQDYAVHTIVDVADESELSQYRTFQNVINIEGQPNVVVGWVFTGSICVPPPGQNQGSLKITRLAFRNRFTMAEKAALYTVAATPQGVGLKVYIDDLAAATYVDLLRDDTVASINYLASLGLLTAPRAAAILDTTTVTAMELYHE